MCWRNGGAVDLEYFSVESEADFAGTIADGGDPTVLFYALALIVFSAAFVRCPRDFCSSNIDCSAGRGDGHTEVVFAVVDFEVSRSYLVVDVVADLPYRASLFEVLFQDGLEFFYLFGAEFSSLDLLFCRAGEACEVIFINELDDFFEVVFITEAEPLLHAQVESFFQVSVFYDELFFVASRDARLFFLFFLFFAFFLWRRDFVLWDVKELCELQLEL